MRIRGSGVLLHLTSLPSSYGIGDLGPSAHKFAGLLSKNRQSFWQVLPLTPTDMAFGNNPYSSCSAFAGNPLLISPDLLLEDGLLAKESLQKAPEFPVDKVDYPKVTDFKKKLLEQAFQAFNGSDMCGYDDFCRENAFWLDDYALFVAIKDRQGGRAWSEWPVELRDRLPEALKKAMEELKENMRKETFFQFLFFKQWLSLKEECTARGIKIIGDMPIYVNYDSADVWSHHEIFKLDQDKMPISVSGVPPDLFSATGQLWGNPTYRWDIMKSRNFDWWVQRISQNLKLFDILRVDHFMGLVAYWEVKAGEKTAMDGQWIEVPHREFFQTLFRHFYSLPVIAEDLGLITPNVREVIHHYGLPGMKVLLFAFGEGMAENPYVPHNVPRNSIIYTGTHDNNTVRGWFEKEATPEDKKRFSSYVGKEIRAEEAPVEMIRLAMSSVACTAIIPMQDILGLGGEARMNYPSKTQGNYQWRLLPEQMELVGWLREMTEIYGRS